MSVARSNHYRVLVADDDAGCRDSLVNLLVHDGFSASAVGLGRHAINALRVSDSARGLTDEATGSAWGSSIQGSSIQGSSIQGPSTEGSTRSVRQRFDFVVLDYNLPDLTGLEILRFVRCDLRLELPAILVTGDFSRDLERSVLEIGGFAVMAKPVQPANFREVVRDLVKRHFNPS